MLQYTKRCIGWGGHCGAGEMWIRNHLIGRLKKNELHLNRGYTTSIYPHVWRVSKIIIIDLHHHPQLQQQLHCKDLGWNFLTCATNFALQPKIAIRAFFLHSIIKLNVCHYWFQVWKKKYFHWIFLKWYIYKMGQSGSVFHFAPWRSNQISQGFHIFNTCLYIVQCLITFKSALLLDLFSALVHYGAKLQAKDYSKL